MLSSCCIRDFVLVSEIERDQGRARHLPLDQRPSQTRREALQGVLTPEGSGFGFPSPSVVQALSLEVREMRGGTREAQGQGGQARGRESVPAFMPKSTYLLL